MGRLGKKQGMCVHSPLVDSLNNSVRGIEVFKRLVQVYSFHAYEARVTDASTCAPCRARARRPTGALDGTDRSRCGPRSIAHALLIRVVAGGKKDARRPAGFAAELAQHNLCGAAAIGDISEMHRLIALGASVHTGDYDGRTPLHLAATEKRVLAVKLLLQEGSRPTAVDRWGFTAIDYAQQAGATAIVDMLRAALAARA